MLIVGIVAISSVVAFCFYHIGKSEAILYIARKLPEAICKERATGRSDSAILDDIVSQFGVITCSE